jgi:hypothetical protein
LFANIAEMHIFMNSNSRHLECSTRLIWFGGFTEVPLIHVKLY